MQQRVYTPRTKTVDSALTLAVQLGLAAPDASQAEKLNQVVAFAESRMSEDLNRLERAQAYEEISRDEERSAAIRASVLNAVRRGIL